MPWVRLHGTKDYLDMVKILAGFPLIRQTFNLVPSLLEQIEDYTERTIKDRFLELSYKRAGELSAQDKKFILENFFSINMERVISYHPRYYGLYLKQQRKESFSDQDFLDLQAWFNLAWIDPGIRESSPEINAIMDKARFFSEEEKQVVLNKQQEILEEIIPAYKSFLEKKQIEITVSPYYHPILPLLYSTKIAKEANPKSTLPGLNFSYPQDALAQIKSAIELYQQKFQGKPYGMWPSEESVCEHIVPYFIQSGIKWIAADEAILFKSLKKKKRDASLLYQPYLLKRKDGNLNVIFRDRNLSDLLGFVYYNLTAQDAVNDFMKLLENIHKSYNHDNILVTIAMDGENAWEYYYNDGIDFLKLLYQTLSESKFVQTTTISEYLSKFPAKQEIKRLAAGSWIYAEFSKWINNPYKNLAWEYLAQARAELEGTTNLELRTMNLAWKQMYILEGSDWFWWYGENHADFDKLFRTHLANFYTIIGKSVPDYLKKPLSPK